MLLAAISAAPAVVVACKTVTTSTDTPPATISALASTSASVSTASASVAASASATAAVSSSAAAATSAPKVDCDKAFKAMQAGPNAVKAKYRACSSDADCATVPGRACLGACDDAIATTGVSEHQRAMKAVEPACNAFINGPCMYSYPIPVPTCPMMIPRCVGGACTAQMK